MQTDIGRHPITDGDGLEAILKGRDKLSKDKLPHLTPEGLVQGFYISQELKRRKISHIYFSPQTRTSDLLKIFVHFLGHEVIYIPEDDLMERDFGSLQGVKIETLKSVVKPGVSWQQELLYADDFRTLSSLVGIDTTHRKFDPGEKFSSWIDRNYNIAERLLSEHTTNQSYKDNVYLLTHTINSNVLYRALRNICQSTYEHLFYDLRDSPASHIYEQLDFGCMHRMQISKVVGATHSKIKLSMLGRHMNDSTHLIPLYYDIESNETDRPPELVNRFDLDSNGMISNREQVNEYVRKEFPALLEELQTIVTSKLKL